MVSKIFFMFTPKIGEMINFDEYFFKWVAQPPTSNLGECFVSFMFTSKGKASASFR